MTDAELIDVVRSRIEAGKPLRRTIGDGGRLHIDRPLPFLCVYRAPADPDPGTADLVRTQASYLIAPAGYDASPLVGAIVAALTAACGGCLVVEVWATASTSPACFRIRTSAGDRLATTVEALAVALRAMTLPTGTHTVEVIAADDAAGAERANLVDPGVARHSSTLLVGLEVPPLYRSARGVYPVVATALSRQLTHALQRAFFEFARVQSPAQRPVEHFQMLGRRRIVHAVRESDVALAEISASFDFLLAVTPVNSDEAWREFCAGGRRHAPVLRYRMLEADPAIGKRRLYDLPLERLEDPVLAQLLHDKRRELDRQLTLLEDRDTARFLLGSLALYGGVEDELLAQALAVLASVPPSPQREEARCDAHGFAARAEAELAFYRRTYPALGTVVSIRDDVSALLVSQGDVLIPAKLDAPLSRVEALLQHELGTHVVTYANGRSQPLRVLAAGLAGYEALQEGLATFAEHVVGGLDGDRLRVVAARVVAVQRMISGVAFPAVVAELTDQHGFAPRTAFSICVRVFRGGGLTKDAIYLRGLVQLLAYLRDGGDIASLMIGKLAIDQVDLIAELLRREVLRPPPLRPRWLDAPSSATRLSRAARGLAPLDLLEPMGPTA